MNCQELKEKIAKAPASSREALERNVAALEGGRHGFAFGSGMTWQRVSRDECAALGLIEEADNG